MPEYESPQVLELVDGEIRGKGSLLTLFSNDTNADIRLQDHAHIITSVADSCGSFAGILSDLLSDQGFLRWRASTDTNRWGLCRLLEEPLFKLFIG